MVLFLLVITRADGSWRLDWRLRWHAAVGNLSAALEGRRPRRGTDGIRRNRLRSFLVASEFALAFMLLIGAGLMIRSFFALESVRPGFNPHHVLSMVVSVAGTKEADAHRREIFYRQLLETIRKLPGAAAAGGINHLPLAGDKWDRSFAIEGRPKPRPGEWPDAVYRIVMPGYFEALRLPLLAGRSITGSDDARASRVVVLNQRAAPPTGRARIPSANASRSMATRSATRRDG